MDFIFGSLINSLKRKENKRKEKQIDKLTKLAKIDYPFLPLSSYVKKMDNYDTDQEFIFEKLDNIPNELIPIESILSDIKDKTITNECDKTMLSGRDKLITNEHDIENLYTIIKFWKAYAFQKMSQIIENISLLDEDSISESPYLSIEIIKAYPDFEYNWQLVTDNIFIHNRDILKNPELPWDMDSLLKRELPIGFFHSKFIDSCSIYKYPKEIQWTEYDILMSPGDPPMYLYTGTFISEEDINSAMLLLKENFNEFFDDGSESFIGEIKESIIENIEMNEKFNIDEYTFPINKDKFNRTKGWRIDNPFEILPTEDDPLSLRDIIVKLKNGNFSNTEKLYYYTKTGLSYDCNIFIKNRIEYVEFLSKQKEYIRNIERCVFFEIKDIDNYRIVFSDCLNNVIANSGKLTIDYVESHPFLGWKMETLVKNLPIEYVFNNLLFYPNRIQLPFFKLDFNMSSKDIHTRLLIEDASLLNVFVNRQDFDFNLMFQYSDINWFIENIYSFRERIPIHLTQKITYSIKTQGNKKEELHKLTWDDLNNGKEIEQLTKHIDAETFLTNNENIREKIIIDIIKKNKEFIELFSNIIPFEVMKNNKKTKWTISQYINLNDLYKEYVNEHKNDKNFIFLPIYLNVLNNYSFYNFSDNMFKYLTLYANQNYNKNKDKSKFYENFILFFAIFMKIFYIFDSDLFTYKLDEYINKSLQIFKIFTIDDIKNSKYQYPDIIIKNIIYNFTKNK